MALQAFRFKQFSVAHDRCTHKVGTDAVLLGAWVSIHQNDVRMLDIGTGSGLIALMLAQRTESKVIIDAIEIEKDAAEQARGNVARSPWPSRVNVMNTRAQDFTPAERYNLVVSNPPFFVNSLLPPGVERQRARHTATLQYEDLLHTVDRCLLPRGRFALILPPEEALNFISLARSFGLFPNRKTTFRARKNKRAERLLIELSDADGAAAETEIILYDEGESWSADYRMLTEAFYLRP